MNSNLFLCALWSLAAPVLVHSCLCDPRTSERSRSDDIRSQFCTRSENVYSAMVTAATCNCIPGIPEREGSSISSGLLNCQHYQLELTDSIINTTLLARGQCEFSRYSDPIPVCSTLGDSFVTWGLSAVDVQNDTIEAVPVGDTTDGERCLFTCPHNLEDSDLYAGQPCVYTVRVREVFKGNYSAGDDLEVVGPDVLTSCGSPDNLLHISESYVMGIGQPCSSISEWSELRSYSNEELQLLRTLQEVDCPSSGSALPALPLTPIILVLLTLLSSIM